jgi:hypothetical protein
MIENVLSYLLGGVLGLCVCAGAMVLLVVICKLTQTLIDLITGETK